MAADKTFSWSNSLEVGHPLMDDEHRELIKRMGRLQDLNGKVFDKKLLLIGMSELIKLTRQHFSDEETLMKKAQYPQWEIHMRIHASLLEALERYHFELETSVYQRFPTSVFDFMKTWITTHIMMVDQQYATFLRQQQALKSSA